MALKNIIAPEKKDWSDPVCAVQCAIDLEKQVTQVKIETKNTLIM